MSSYDNDTIFSLSVVVIYPLNSDNEWQGILGVVVIGIICISTRLLYYDNNDNEIAK